MALGYDVWSTTRRHLQKVFSTSPPLFPFLTELQPPFFYLQSSVSMHLPCEVGDYTDFYASKEHATNVGTLFRGAENALMPNWLHLPIGYHGRASSIQVSSSSTSTSTSTSSLVHRPWGQSMHAHFGPSKKLDFELEMAFLIGTGNPIAKPIPLNETKKRIFGAVIMNDWSARDIQAWVSYLFI
ncbi:hypothetical protein HMI54_003546 [Coelomomyces lativittatus]|nr:hypothetical protein HMI55_001153 [Coelomomyces lativittatus]KAJ1508095.1 hypothetical protein HMI54_003546 [Coelomomyces lativittatus]